MKPLPTALLLTIVILLFSAWLWWWPAAVQRDLPAPQPPPPAAPVAGGDRDAAPARHSPKTHADAMPASEPGPSPPAGVVEAAGNIRARCAPARQPIALPSALLETSERILSEPEPADREAREASMSQCLELRDQIYGAEIPLFSRDHGDALEHARRAVARCWQRWQSGRATDDGGEPAHTRADATNAAVNEAYRLVEEQDWDALLALSPELAAMDAPLSVYDDWDPAVDLPYILALRADAPDAHFLDLLQSGLPPSPRALSRLAMLGRIEVLAALAEAGADITATDIAGNDVVHGALQSGDADVVRELAALGVDFNRRTMHQHAQHWPLSGDEAPAGGEEDLIMLLRDRPQMAAEVIRGGYAVGPEHLQEILLRAPRSLADRVYRELREDGCA